MRSGGEEGEEMEKERDIIEEREKLMFVNVKSQEQRGRGRRNGEGERYK